MKSWLRCILIVNFGVRNKIPKIPNAHQVILKFFRKQNIKGYRSDKRKFLAFLFVFSKLTIPADAIVGYNF